MNKARWIVISWTLVGKEFEGVLVILICMYLKQTYMGLLITVSKLDLMFVVFRNSMRMGVGVFMDCNDAYDQNLRTLYMDLIIIRLKLWQCFWDVKSFLRLGARGTTWRMIPLPQSSGCLPILICLGG